MKVLFLPAHSQLSADSRLKVYQFLPLLEEAGVKYSVICFAPLFLYKKRVNFGKKIIPLMIYYILIYVFRFLKTIQVLFIANKYDIIYIQQPIIPFGMEKLLKIINKNIIFQFTDAIFINKRNGENALEQLRSQIISKKCTRMASVAKCCLVENDYNKQGISKFCKNIKKITGPIDTERYSPSQNKNKSKEIIIGWTGSTFTTKYLYEIEDVLKSLATKYKFVLRVIGASKNFSIEGVNCEVEDWSLNTELDLLSTFDVGIMPLSDDEWTKGKSSYKLLQYMSMGITPVISPVGLVGFDNQIITDGINGFIADKNEKWVEKISMLIENEDLRKKMGANARATIEEHYSLKNGVKKMLKIFEETISLE